MERHEDIVQAVVERIADREGTDPLALDPPLHAVVDTGALTALFSDRRETRPGTVVEFTYHGYRVTIEDRESITLCEVSEPTA